jgi:hypothetical protein
MMKIGVFHPNYLYPKNSKGAFKQIVFMFMRNYKENPLLEGAKIFSFSDLMNLKIWDFWQTPAGDVDWWPGPQKVQFWEITGYL